MTRLTALIVGVWLLYPAAQPAKPAAAVRGLTSAPLVAQAYNAILDADFARVPAQLATTCPPAPTEACRVLEALAAWWEISLEPESRSRDAKFVRAVDRAIAATEAWTRREPERAEAWFYLGAAHGARTQWRVLRQQRLPAARDGKRIKEALDRALALDPDLHDAKFGAGLYRYYADVAPAAQKMLRWGLLLPGGDRIAGLRQLTDARDRGQVVRSEADYQLHLIYLWYEKRSREALALVQGLQKRHPGNPLFYQLEAEIQDVYFHNPSASHEVSMHLLALAEAKHVHEPRLASVRARLNMANQLSKLGERQRAIDLLNGVIAERPSRPAGSLGRAQTLLKTVRSRPRR